MTNTTRRSFIKKSVVAAVAATNLTIFSGLVNASYQYDDPDPCTVDKWHGTWGDGGNFQQVDVLFCQTDADCSGVVTCGSFYELDAIGKVKVQANGQPVISNVIWMCDEMEDNPFSGPEFPNEPDRIPAIKKCLP